MARSGLHAVPRQVSMHVQQLSWQDTRVPEVGTTADKISDITLARQYRERGRKQLFQTADQTLSTDGSRLVGTVLALPSPSDGKQRTNGKHAWGNRCTWKCTLLHQQCFLHMHAEWWVMRVIKAQHVIVAKSQQGHGVLLNPSLSVEEPGP